METLLQNNLGIYYFLLFAICLIAIICNVSKEKRIGQLKIAELYAATLIVAVIVVVLKVVFSSFLNNIQNINVLNYAEQIFVAIISLVHEFVAKIVEGHQIILLCMFGIITVSKFGMKIKYRVNLVDMTKIKKRLLYKICFDENTKLTEKGRMVLKISQNMCYTLVIWYLIVPLLLYYDIEIFYSSVITIFLALVFLEIVCVLNVFVEKQEEVIEEKIKDDSWNSVTNKLSGRLKHNSSENRENSDKMILHQNGDLFGDCNLICEVPNFEQFKDVNMSVMNTAFFENKKVLVICLNSMFCKEYYQHLSVLNKEYDGKLAIKMLTEEDKIFDESVDIYISTLEICFGNIKLLNRINTVIIEDIDLIMKSRVELLRTFGNIMKMGNPDVRYIILTYMFQGMEAAVKNLLLLEELAWYNTEHKQQSAQVILNVWDKNNVDIGDGIFGRANNNIGNLIPLALLSTKKDIDRTLIISATDPIEFQINELNNIKNLSEKKITNKEIDEINNRLCLSKREKYFEYKNNNYIVANDNNYNLYDSIYKLSLINGKNNHINIVSNQYLLRDYMIDNYKGDKARLKQFLPYIPCQVDNSKVILHSLILQLTNFGVNESNLVRIFNQNNIKVSLTKRNNAQIISKALNEYIKREFDVLIDTYPYIMMQESDENFVFDANNNSFMVNEIRYGLDKSILTVLPKTLFREIKFIKDGFVLDIEKEYSYNFYQKYLPGQKHSLNGMSYIIKEVIDINGENEAVVELSTDYDNNDYRQLRIINMINDISIKEKIKHDYEDITVTYTLGTTDYIINTEGYYEFNNGIILTPNENRYIQLSNENKEKTRRTHKNAKVLKIDISVLNEKAENITKLFEVGKKDQIAYAFSFILSEVLFSMLGENANYIQVKAKTSEEYDFNSCAWVWPIIGDPNENNSIELYIFEDVELERGLVDIIYKNIDNILELIYDYLRWIMVKDVISNTLNAEQFTYLTYVKFVLLSCGDLKELLSRIVLK